MKRTILWGMLAALVFSMALTGCGGGTENTTLYSENFESYAPANPWSPPDASGWKIVEDLMPNTYAIVSESGNHALQIYGSDGGIFYQDGFSGQDYIVSVKFKIDRFYADYAFGIVARLVDDSHQYLFRVNNMGIDFEKNNGNSGISGIASADFNYFTNNMTYTMTLKVEGNTLTGTITDGTHTASTSYTDDSSPFTSGKVGIYLLGTAATGREVTTTIDDLVVSRIN